MLGNAKRNAEAMPKIFFGGILGNAKGNFFRASWEGNLPGNPGRKARGCPGMPRMPRMPRMPGDAEDAEDAEDARGTW